MFMLSAFNNRVVYCTKYIDLKACFKLKYYMAQHNEEAVNGKSDPIK